MRALASEREPELRCVILDAAEAVFYLNAAALARLMVDLRARGWQLTVAGTPAVLVMLRSNRTRKTPRNTCRPFAASTSSSSPCSGLCVKTLRGLN
ncbi:MAG: hypothetical protein ACM3ZF_05355 [Mycobacterium leprae]